MPDTPVSDKIHIADLVTCPKCGQSNAVGERYCITCGAHLTGVATTAAAKAEPPKKPGLLGRLTSRK